MDKLEFIPTKEFMIEAFKLAKIAKDNGEVPVGAVIELNGEIIGVGYNSCEKDNSQLKHAEIKAIEMATEKTGNWRLKNCNIYVTLEPCPMCTGAIINSRINHIVFAAHDFKSGCCGSVTDLTKLDFLHKPKIYRGFMEEESVVMLKDFFKNIR
ncbi:MAG: nucleoside deaminase [Clostridia bacterium]